MMGKKIEAGTRFWRHLLLKLHGIAALCNICFDKTAAKFIREHLNLLIGQFVRTDHPEIVIHSLALFYQLLEVGEVDRELLLSPSLLRTVQEWRLKTQDQRIVKLCQLLLEDFARRTEIIELQNATPVLPAAEQPQQVQVVKRFSQSDLEQFAQFTGDHNYIHSVDTERCS